jgi:hypothetical protein
MVNKDLPNLHERTPSTLAGVTGTVSRGAANENFGFPINPADGAVHKNSLGISYRYNRRLNAWQYLSISPMPTSRSARNKWQISEIVFFTVVALGTWGYLGLMIAPLLSHPPQAKAPVTVPASNSTPAVLDTQVTKPKTASVPVPPDTSPDISVHAKDIDFDEFKEAVWEVGYEEGYMEGQKEAKKGHIFVAKKRNKWIWTANPWEDSTFTTPLHYNPDLGRWKSLCKAVQHVKGVTVTWPKEKE